MSIGRISLFTLRHYCESHIENYSLLESLALDRIDHMGCPLSMACPELERAMTECIEEYCEEHNKDSEDYDTEDVFWAEEEDDAHDMSPEEEWAEYMNNVCETEYFNY